jgi:hypothetical protein
MRAPAHARPLRLALAFALAASVASARPASAYYEESHVTSDEARVTLDASGVARVQHTFTWKLVAGKPHGIDVAGVEPSAEPEAGATLEAADGSVLAATLAQVPGHGLRLTIADPKALRHGQEYQVHLAYGVNLQAAGELVRDGSAFRLLWKSPVPAEGYDAAKVTFILPAAIEAPSALIGEGGMPDDGVASTLKREADHDEVTLVRPHVGRGEDVLWAVRIPAKAFDGGKSPGLAPPPPPPRQDAQRGAGALAYGILLVLAAAFAGAVHWNERRFAEACRALALAPRALVPLPSRERAALAGAALFVGLSLQLVDAPVGGSVVLVLAMASAVLCPQRAASPVRGPGRWLVLRPEEAFAAGGGSGPRGVLAVVGMLALWLAAGRLLLPAHPEAPRLLAVDLLALLPLVLTGRASQLPADGLCRRGPWLGSLYRRLRKTKSLRVSPWVRVPVGQVRPDEVRVLVVPRAPMPGLSAIEIGFAASPEVLVRVQEATAASARLTCLAPEVVPVPGRKPEERVYRLRPRFPTRSATAALVLSLGQRLIDRRLASAAWEKDERRLPPGAHEENASNAPIPVLG